VDPSPGQVAGIATLAESVIRMAASNAVGRSERCPKAGPNGKPFAEHTEPSLHVSFVLLPPSNVPALQPRAPALIDLCSALSTLFHWRESFAVLLLTNNSTRSVIQDSYPDLAARVQFQTITISRVLDRLGLNASANPNFMPWHATLVIADLVPQELRQTIMIDLDVHFSPVFSPRCLAQVWSQFLPGEVLAASEIPPIHPCGGRPRLNSGVVLMDLRQMRQHNWTGWIRREMSAMLANPMRVQRDGYRVFLRRQGTGHKPERRQIDCTVAGSGGSLAEAFGDQDWLSHMCNYDEGIGRCRVLPAWVHSDRCTAVRRTSLLHYNCGPRPDLCRHTVGDYSLSMATYQSALDQAQRKRLQGIEAHKKRLQVKVARLKVEGQGRGHRAALKTR